VTTTTGITSQSSGSPVSTQAVDHLGPRPRSARREVILDTASQLDRSTGRDQNLNSIISPGFTQQTSQTSLTLPPRSNSHSVATSKSRSIEHVTLAQERINNLFQMWVLNMVQRNDFSNDSPGTLSTTTYSLLSLNPPCLQMLFMNARPYCSGPSSLLLPDEMKMTLHYFRLSPHSSRSYRGASSQRHHTLCSLYKPCCSYACGSFPHLRNLQTYLSC
jgi:hypothetical protein